MLPPASRGTAEVFGFDDAKAFIAKGRSSGPQIDDLLRMPYEHPAKGEAALYGLTFVKLQRRNSDRIVRSLIEILNDKQLDAAVRAQAPEGIGVHIRPKRRALRRVAVTALRRQLRDESPEVRFWSTFGLAMLNAREACCDLRFLQADNAVVSGWWTVGDEASDALDLIERRDPPDRRSHRPQGEGSA